MHVAKEVNVIRVALIAICPLLPHLALQMVPQIPLLLVQYLPHYQSTWSYGMPVQALLPVYPRKGI